MSDSHDSRPAKPEFDPPPALRGRTQPNQPTDPKLRTDSVPAGSRDGGSLTVRHGGSVIVVDPSPLSLLTLAGILHHEGYECVCARDAKAAIAAASSAPRDIVVWDVGSSAPDAIAGINTIRESAEYEMLPIVFIAEHQWAGLEKKTEAMRAPSRCLFKPIDPASLVAVVQQTLWMPSLVNAHRRRGSKPSRPGWVTLD